MSDLPIFLAGLVVFVVVTAAVVAALRDATAAQRERAAAERRQASLIRRRQAYLASTLAPPERDPVRLPFSGAATTAESAAQLRALLSTPSGRGAAERYLREER